MIPPSKADRDSFISFSFMPLKIVVLPKKAVSIFPPEIFKNVVITTY